mgnify:CR=1 FL=1
MSDDINKTTVTESETNAAWLSLMADKDAEIARLKAKIEWLEDYIEIREMGL